MSRLGADRKPVYVLKSFDDFFARLGELDVCSREAVCIMKEGDKFFGYLQSFKCCAKTCFW